MTTPIDFTAVSPRFDLPYLVSGQAQKEAFINEALARIDLLLYTVVEDELAIPPVDPLAGQAWIVASGASGEWAGMERHIAGWDGEQWSFVAPIAGQVVMRPSSMGRLIFDGSQWLAAPPLEAPQGGSVVDDEARAAIVAILHALERFGLAKGN